MRTAVTSVIMTAAIVGLGLLQAQAQTPAPSQKTQCHMECVKRSTACTKGPAGCNVEHDSCHKTCR